MKDLELRQIFASNLRSILQEKKLTQKALGERIERSGEQVSRWINAKTSPSWEHLCLISEALSTSASELLTPKKTNTVVYQQPSLNFSLEKEDPDYFRFKRFKEVERIFAKF